jgi:hypothetical protein|tara:strand:- start:9 stop:323 length:315 start_codon:yes stop_codon:yes gene_type:complete
MGVKPRKVSKHNNPYKTVKTGKGARSPGVLAYTAKNLEHATWCISNGISVTVTPNWKTTSMWIVEISINKAVNTDPIDYTGEQALYKMYEYFKYYHDKYNKNIK